MNPARQPGASQGPAVLRGVLLHAQPHALARPGRIAAEPVSRMRQAEPGQPARGDCAADDGSAAAAAYKAGLAEGHMQGYEAACAVAAQEARALEATRADLRAVAAIEGRLEGLKQGREEALTAASKAEAQAKERADQATADRLDRLDQLLQSLTVEGAGRLEEAEEDLVALSHEIVCRILGAEAAQPARVRSMVTHLLAQHGQRPQLAVHLHPDDLAALMKEREGLRATSWRWVGDSAVHLGGVVLHSPEGSLDARLETQVAALGDTLRRLRRDRKDAALHDTPEIQQTGAAT